MIVKVCGMRDAENIREVDALGIDLMGFIFYDKSPRYVSTRPSALPVAAQRVGVFVNADVEQILAKSQEFGLSYAQLHGSESPEMCMQLRGNGLKIIKAFSISSAADFADCASYEHCCDYYLFDTKTASYGGSGRMFDWSLLEAYRGTLPFLLSGGIGPNTEVELAHHPMLAGFDLNSRFETAAAIKDAAMLKAIIKRIKH